MTGKLDATKVTSKIVICDRGGNGRVAKGYAVKQACDFEMILVNTVAFGEELIADAHLLPATNKGIVTHGIYSAVVLGHGLWKVYDHRRRLRQ